MTNYTNENLNERSNLKGKSINNNFSDSNQETTFNITKNTFYNKNEKNKNIFQVKK
jgi:hypothetical protein